MNATNSPIPPLGFGTYGRTGGDGIDAIGCALETGYRHLDTAQSYDTEAEVGQAVRQSGLARGDVFVTTKITPENFGPGKLVPSLERSLETLQLDQVDLTLIHWPSPNGELPLEVYMTQLAEAKAKNLTRLIGVSNFTIALLEQAFSIVGQDQIATNQVELNPLFQNRTLADFCMANDVMVTCYQPIANGRLKGVAILDEIAERHDATAEQIALAHELALGYAAIPTSSRPERIRSNYKALDVALTEEDIAQIGNVPQAARSIDPDWGPDWDA